MDVPVREQQRLSERELSRLCFFSCAFNLSCRFCRQVRTFLQSIQVLSVSPCEYSHDQRNKRRYPHRVFFCYKKIYSSTQDKNNWDCNSSEEIVFLFRFTQSFYQFQFGITDITPENKV